MKFLKLLLFFQNIGCWVVYIAKIMSFWNLPFWNVDLKTASPLRNILIIRIIRCFHWNHHWCNQIWLTTFPFFLPKKRNENSKKFSDQGQTSIFLLPKFSLADCWITLHKDQLIYFFKEMVDLYSCKIWFV